MNAVRLIIFGILGLLPAKKGPHIYVAISWDWQVNPSPKWRITPPKRWVVTFLGLTLARCSGWD